ncbi:hypothetical protein RRG08_032559 [Elysia crispata]|uniref:Uncharacterized protein n=1 Tax=Elysia crispata TaxID=231223 RepID=A0AAE0ZYS2_9GAST|nr:hypothetical protein RRG08_032559 [Elysia crispata]
MKDGNCWRYSKQRTSVEAVEWKLLEDKAKDIACGYPRMYLHNKELSGFVRCFLHPGLDSVYSESARSRASVREANLQ